MKAQAMDVKRELGTVLEMRPLHSHNSRRVVHEDKNVKLLHIKLPVLLPRHWAPRVSGLGTSPG